MDIYISLFILFLISALCEPKLPLKLNNLLFIINGIFLFVVVAGRTCGTDYWLYYRVIKSGSEFDANWPFVYSLLAHYLPYQLLKAIEALFTLLPLYLVFDKVFPKSKNFLAFFLLGELLFGTLMQQSRQGVAISLSIYAFFCEDNKLKASFVTLLGLIFHSTALIGLLLIFIPKKYFSHNFYIYLYLLCLVMGSFLLEFILSNVNLLGISYLIVKFDGYLERTEIMDLKVNLFSFRIFLFLFLLFFCIKFVDCKNRIFVSCVNSLFLGVCFYTLFSPIPDLSIRGSRFFLYQFSFILSYLSFSFTSKLKQAIWIFSLIYESYYFTQGYFNSIKDNDLLDLFPYYFFIQ